MSATKQQLRLALEALLNTRYELDEATRAARRAWFNTDSDDAEIDAANERMGMAERRYIDARTEARTLLAEE